MVTASLCRRTNDKFMSSTRFESILSETVPKSSHTAFQDMAIDHERVEQDRVPVHSNSIDR